MHRRRNNLVWEEVLEEQSGCDSRQAKKGDSTGHEKDSVDHGPLDGLRSNEASCLLQSILYGISVSICSIVRNLGYYYHSKHDTSVDADRVYVGVVE